MDPFDELIAAPPGRALCFSTDRYAWCVDGESALVPVDPLEAALLPRLALLETMDAHAGALSRALNAPPDAVAAALRRLRARGLVWTLEEFLGTGQGEAAPAPDPLVAIRTRGRPAALAALLESLLDDERRFGAVRRYLVIDDAPAAMRDPRVAEAVARFARDSASEVRLLDAGNRSRLVGDLAPSLRGLFDADAADRPSGARAWNLALLCGAGGTLGLLDDDFRFPLYSPTWAAAVLDPATDAGYTTRWLDGLAPDAIGLSTVDSDPFEWLGAMLGVSCAGLVDRFGIDAAAARRRPVATLPGRFGPRRASVVGVGVHGALNEDSGVHVLAGDPGSRASLTRPPFDPRRLRFESVWRGVPAPRLMAVGVFTPLLVDARTLRPPTLPHGKADDSLFLALLPAIDPGAGYLAMPASIGHVDAAPRDRLARTVEPDREDPCAWLASVVAHSIASLPTKATEARVRMLSALMRGLAGADEEELALRVLEWRDRRLPGLIARLRHARRELGPSPPPELSTLLDAAADANERLLFKRQVPAGQAATMREACAALAEALDVWPELWASAGSRWLDRIDPVTRG
jgi:hypothetical protein